MARTRQTRISRRVFLARSAAGAAAAAGLAWPRTGSAAGPEVVVGHWGGAGPKVIRTAIFPDLQAKFPTAKLFIREGGDQDRKAMLQANPTNPEIDVLYVSNTDAKQMTRDGLTDPPNPQAVPEFANLYPIAQDGAYGVYLHAIALIYDPEKVKSPPTSWLDLWKPEYRNRVLVPNTKTAVNQAFVTAVVRALGGSERKEKDVEEARKKLLELRSNVVVFHTGTSQALTVIKSGDAWLGVAVAGYAYGAKDKGQSVDVAYPKEGALGAIDYMTVARHSKNKDLAHAYINLALGRKAQKDFVEEVYWGPTNKTVEVSPKARERAVIGEDAVKKLINPDWDYLVTVRSEWTDWWDKNMGK
jgi:putative spermidine/putrescine transport system substrate-binding protein